MRWETVPTNISDLEEYQLTDGDQVRVTVKYNAQQHTARINTNDSKRMFFIQQHAGILKSKTVFTNEYGVEIGKLSTDNFHNNIYTLDLQGKKYHIAYRHDSDNELVVYKKSVNDPIAKCGMQAENNKTYEDLSSKAFTNLSSLILGLCWYLFSPVTEHIPELAA